MKKRRTIQAKITDNDRFGMTFFLATIFHGMVILGVTFSIAPSADSKTAPALDIILVQTKSPSDVEDADYLAQVSQQGGGRAAEKARQKQTPKTATNRINVLNRFISNTPFLSTTKPRKVNLMWVSFFFETNIGKLIPFGITLIVAFGAIC